MYGNHPSRTNNSTMSLFFTVFARDSKAIGVEKCLFSTPIFGTIRYSLSIIAVGVGTETSGATESESFRLFSSFSFSDLSALSGTGRNARK